MTDKIATKVLKTVLDKVGSTVGGKIFEAGLTAVLGSDTERIQGAVNQVLRDVAEVKKAVDEVSQKLDAGIQQLRSDTLTAHLTSINTNYQTVQDCITAAFQAKNEITSSTQLNQKLADLQANLNRNLEHIRDNVPGLLDQINSFLMDPTFIKGAADIALKNSVDFFGFYLKMKTLFMQYWAGVIQGIALLQMVEKSSSVHWAEGSVTVKRHSEKLQRQDEFLREKVGIDTCLVSELLLAGKKDIWFRSSWGEGFKLQDWKKGGNHFSMPCAKGKAEEVPWLIELENTMGFQPDQVYDFRLWEKHSGFRLRDWRHMDQPNAVCEETFLTKDSTDDRWRLIPSAVGSREFWLLPLTDPGAHMFVEFEHNALQARDKNNMGDDHSRTVVWIAPGS